MTGTLKITQNATGVVFTVHVQPRASRNEICGLHDGELKVRLTSPPVEDAANKLCVEFLAKQLGVAKSRVAIISGAKSRHKIIMIDGIDSEALHALLADADRPARSYESG